MLRYTADAPLESAVCFNRQQPTSSSTVFESKSQDAGEDVLARKLKRFTSEAEAEFHELRELVKSWSNQRTSEFCAKHCGSCGIVSPGVDWTPRCSVANCLRLVFGPSVIF